MVKQFSTDPIYIQEIPDKTPKAHFKFLSPKDDIFTKRNRTLDSARKAEIAQRKAKTKVYN